MCPMSLTDTLCIAPIQGSVVGDNTSVQKQSNQVGNPFGPVKDGNQSQLKQKHRNHT